MCTSPERRSAFRALLPSLGGWFFLSVLFLLTRSVSFLCVGWITAALALALQLRKKTSWALSLFLLGVAAVMPDDPQSSSFVIASCVMMIISGRTMLCRGIALASILLTALHGSMTGLTALLCGATIAAVLGGKKLRYALIILALAAGVVFMELPDASDHPDRIAQERHLNEFLVWESVPSLYGGSPGAVFRTSGSDGDLLYIPVDAGGVRDNLPVGVVLFGDECRTFGAGVDTIVVPALQPVTVRLCRPWAPFEHPVIHFGHVWTEASR